MTPGTSPLKLRIRKDYKIKSRKSSNEKIKIKKIIEINEKE